MARVTARQRAEFTAQIQREMEAGDQCLADFIARRFMRWGATYCRLQKETCSVERSEREEKRAERQEAQIEKRITDICDGLGWPSPIFGGDPRGHTVKLVVPSGRTTDWGQEGIAVPTS